MNDSASQASTTQGRDAHPEPAPNTSMIVGARRRGGGGGGGPNAAKRKDKIEATQPMGVNPFNRALVNTLSPGAERLMAVLLGAADTLIWTANKRYKDLIIYLVNVDTVQRTATLAHVESRVTGVTAITDTNTLLKAAPIPIGGNILIAVPGIDCYEAFYGKCDSANKVTAVVYGVNAEQ